VLNLTPIPHLTLSKHESKFGISFPGASKLKRLPKQNFFCTFEKINATAWGMLAVKFAFCLFLSPFVLAVQKSEDDGEAYCIPDHTPVKIHFIYFYFCFVDP
jgi:hypothetical protein